MRELELDQWVEIPPQTPEEIQRVGRVNQVTYGLDGRVEKFSVWWEAVEPPMPCGQATQGHYSWRDLNSGFIRPLGALDRLARET